MRSVFITINLVSVSTQLWCSCHIPSAKPTFVLVTTTELSEYQKVLWLCSFFDSIKFLLPHPLSSLVSTSLLITTGDVNKCSKHLNRIYRFMMMSCSHTQSVLDTR